LIYSASVLDSRLPQDLSSVLQDYFNSERMQTISARAIGLAISAVAMAQAFSSSVTADDHSWTSWGNGSRVDNYSSAEQINKSNVATLHAVWSYELQQRGAWELTPIVADGMLYGQDLRGNAFALDPETGKELWHFSSGVRASNRAVSYWPGDAAHKARVIVAVTDRIYAVEAATGLPVKGFGGERGYVDIREGFTEAGPSYRMTSPPTVYKNLIITGVSTQEFGSKGPPADPRAYDAITGKLVWRFHVVPRPGEANFGSWGPDGWQDRSGPSTWGMMSVDEETGMVYIPVGQPADNYVGIDRPGDNLYADSVLALDAATGTYRWHFQLVHHDLFDYDIAVPPTLVDLTIEGKRVPALVEVTKQALMFILDRRTGKPVFGVEERPVPRSTIPGEPASPTQPFPLKPEPLGKLGVTRADITTITSEANRYCTDSWNRMGFKDTPLFTPPSLHGPNLFTPTNAGGLGGVWGGVSVDPRTGYIFVNVSNMAAYNYIFPDDGKSGGPANSGYRTVSAFTKWMDQNGMPCIQPPWGEMVAVNGNTGEVAWRVPLGKAEVYRDLGEHSGMINYAGSVTTAGGLLFIGGTTMACSQCKHDEPVVRALDTRTGLELWRARLSAGTKSNLMTFTGKSGRQYVVATSSGRPDTDVAMVAFALPRPGDLPVNIHPAPLPPSGLGPAAAGAAAGAGLARVEDLPAGAGRDDVAKTCVMCHAIAMVTATPRTLDGWNTSLDDMRARGAKLDEATAKRIAAYLAAHFGPKNPGAAAARPAAENE
jgi:quinoprotein glucose dehydrogenase